MRRLTETDTNAVINALRTAADQYLNDADTVETTEDDGRTARAFRLQAKEARRLAEWIDGYLIVLE